MQISLIKTPATQGFFDGLAKIIFTL